VLLQFLAELRDLDADQSVVAGVVVSRAAENVHADLLLAKSIGRIVEAVFA